MKNRLIIFVFIKLLTTSPSYAQDSLRSKLAKSENERWHIFNNEAGINISSLAFSGGKTGAAIIYKRRIEQGQFVRVKQTRALRFLLGLNLFDWSRISPKDTFSYTISSTQNVITNRSSRNITSFALSVGYEIQQNNGRFQFFYGLDLGGGFASNVNDLSTLTLLYDQGNGNFYPYFLFGEIVGNRYSASIHAFGGIKYFIHQRVSLSLESSLGLGYSYVNLKSQNTGVVYENSAHNISALTQAKRILSVNFHF
jgi:hypothetical protein